MARRKKGSSVKVNFKGVESRQTPPEGDYKVEVLEATLGKSGNNNDQIEFVLEVAEGKYKGTKLWFYCPLQENSLWKLHAFLTALGQEVPEDEMDIDLSELVGESCVGVLTHETYQGRKRAKMTDFDSIENYKGSDDDDDDDDDKKGKKSKGKKSKDETPDYDDMDEDDLRDLVIKRELADKKAAKKLDEDELKELLEDDDKAAAKKSKGKSKGKSKDDDDDDKPAKGKSKSKSKSKDDDDDDEPKGKSKSKDKGKSKKKAKKYDGDDIDDMDEDELQEVIDESDIDVDLDDYKKLPKKVAAVKDALEEADLLED
jgi:hypothetical protein